MLRVDAVDGDGRTVPSCCVHPRLPAVAAIQNVENALLQTLGGNGDAMTVANASSTAGPVAGGGLAAMAPAPSQPAQQQQQQQQIMVRCRLQGGAAHTDP